MDKKYDMIWSLLGRGGRAAQQIRKHVEVHVP